MSQRSVVRLLATTFLAAGLAVFVAAPAHAQLGSMHGRAVDESGKPVADADVTYDFVGEMNFHFTGKTDSKGEFNRGGLQLAAGRWTVTIKKGDLAGQAANLEVPKGNALQVGDIVLRKGGGAGAQDSKSGGKAPAVDLTKLFADVKAGMAAGSYDDVIAKLNDAVAKAPKCGACFTRLGDAYFKKGDLDNAEKSYLQTVSIDDKSKDAGEAYGGLVQVYNQQAANTKDSDERKKKFDQAAQANQKVMDIEAATGGPAGAAGGGGDATSAYNQGVILVNQSKMADAKAQFQKAIQMNPNMAEAYYQLAMCQANENDMNGAKTNLTKYLQLAPTGPNAQTAKDILAALK